LALKGQFKYMIYISCGRRALLRDLETLCAGGFNVADLAVIDLFPGTDAVESLVLLERGGNN
jgi:23S rRNA (uracil1939-C5)-methyltransferase